MAMQIVSTLRPTLGGQLRDEMTSLIGPEFEDVRRMGEQVADQLDEYQKAVAADQASGAYTAVGLSERRKLHGQRLAEAETAILRDARQRERHSSEQLDTLVLRLKLAPRDLLEFEQLRQIALKLEACDPLTREQHLFAAARANTEAGDFILRAALTGLPAPLPGFEDLDDNWRPLVTPALLKRLREVLSDRVSPQGFVMWQCSALRSIGSFISSALGSPDDPIVDLAATGTTA